MSDLQRSFAKAKLAGLPFEPPLPPNLLEEEEEEDEFDDLKPLPESNQDDDSSSASSASSASSTGTIRPSPSVLSLDARGHGETVVEALGPHSGNEIMDLSLEVLSKDLLEVIQMTQRELAWLELPGLILIGHSLGGAVVTNLAISGNLGNAVLGYAVLDVVEGSAIDALQSMQSYLSTRPKTFLSISSAIEWHTRSRTIRNTTSARISVPSLLRSEVAGSSDSHASQHSKIWTWRTDLAATQPYWEGWFAGLSRKFLDARGGKLLLLAGTDRLDKELMIGQMQGKYQLQVFPEAGHFIHEDQAEKTAMVVADFYKRNDRSALVLPPKVSDMLKAKTSI
ncbi:protein phosphatase methylesterase 1, partial [Lecanoromycetidae sp. Uapishka_2]